MENEYRVSYHVPGEVRRLRLLRLRLDHLGESLHDLLLDVGKVQVLLKALDLLRPAAFARAERREEVEAEAADLLAGPVVGGGKGCGR